MKINELRTGKTEYTTKYKYLYHLTDPHGYAYTIDNDALKTLRESYISTTWNPKMNSVYGHHHYHFKFILNAEPLAEKYGVFPFDYHTNYSDGTTGSLNEDEIGIETRVIENFHDYLIGTILLFPIFSQTAIQWLLYDNPESGGFLDRTKSKAPRAVEMLYKQLFEWRIPIYIGQMGKAPTEREKSFLKDVFRIHRSGGDFYKGMLSLSDKYPILDHSGRELTSTTVQRREKRDELTKLFNTYFSGRKYKDVDPKEVRKIVKEAMNIIGMNNNIQAVIFHELEKGNLFHKVIAAVDWSIIFRELFDGDVDEAIESIRWVANNRKRNIEWYDTEEEGGDVRRYGSHVGTQF